MKEYIFEMSQEKMNKVVLANGSVGVIRYIGPILDGKNEEGQNWNYQIVELYLKLFKFRYLVWNRVGRSESWKA